MFEGIYSGKTENGTTAILDVGGIMYVAHFLAPDAPVACPEFRGFCAAIYWLDHKGNGEAMVSLNTYNYGRQTRSEARG
jgi:hypothetical protein